MSGVSECCRCWCFLCCHDHSGPTRLDVQRVLIDGQVHGLIRCVTEVLQDQIDRGGDTTGNGFAKFHAAVDHNAAVPEVQDLQVLKVCQVGLQVGHELREKVGKCDAGGIDARITTLKIKDVPILRSAAPRLCTPGSSC